jgi:hypothetical protein
MMQFVSQSCVMLLPAREETRDTHAHLPWTLDVGLRHRPSPKAIQQTIQHRAGTQHEYLPMMRLTPIQNLMASMWGGVHLAPSTDPSEWCRLCEMYMPHMKPHEPLEHHEPD